VRNVNRNWNYKLPRRDFRDIERVLSEAKRDVLNVGLYLDKYIYWRKKGGKEEAKIDEMVDKLRTDGKKTIPCSLLPLNLYENYSKRINSLITDLEAQSYYTLKYKAELLWRLAINLGAGSVYETSISLHRNYSVPIIPGSAVKGVANHYAHEYGKLTKNEHGDIFGTQTQRGKVIFFDGLPIVDINNDFIVLDVMNVHYRGYYDGKEDPGDWMDPNPIFFLAVENLRYLFALASKDKSLAEKALNMLKEALKNIGIGAKTSAGYGYFDGIR